MAGGEGRCSILTGRRAAEVSNACRSVRFTTWQRAWEADRRHPEGAALRQLDIGRREPAWFFSLVSRGAPRPSGPNGRRASRKRAKRSGKVTHHAPAVLGMVGSWP
jgi:hypothetical protein